MQQKEFSIKTKDGLTMHAIEWKPEGTPKGGILLVHGIGEHIGRYQHVAKMLTNAGYAIVGFDLRGHGKSEGIRGHSPSYDALMDDIHNGIDIVKQSFPGVPVFLYGHSLGGNLVLYYTVTQDSDIKGCISTSPALGVTVPIGPAKMLLGKIMYAIYPTFLMKNGLNPDDLSRDSNIGRIYVDDPLVHPYTSARLGLDLLNSGQFILDHTSNIKYPILLMQGSMDRLVNPELTRKFAKIAPSDMVTYKEWEGYYHELHNDPENNKVFQGMVDWLESHLQ